MIAVFLTICFPVKANAMKKEFSFINTTTAITETMQFQFSVNSSDVTWSVNDTTRAKIKKDGTLIPRKKGWITVKAENKKSGQKIKQKVLIADMNGTVDTQKKLNATLFSPYVTTITIQTEEAKEFIIGKDYPYEKDSLILNAPNSTITLYDSGKFKYIKCVNTNVNDLTEDQFIVGPGDLYRFFEAVVTNVYAKGEIEVESREDSYKEDICYFKKGERIRIRYDRVLLSYSNSEEGPTDEYCNNIMIGDIVRISYVPTEKLDKNNLYFDNIDYMNKPEFKAVVTEVYSEKEIQIEAKENLYFQGVKQVQYGDKIRVSFDYMFTKYSPADASRQQIDSIKTGDAVVIPWLPYGKLNKDNLHSSEIYSNYDSQG